MSNQTLNLDVNDLLDIEFALREYGERLDSQGARRVEALADLMRTGRCAARDDGTGQATAVLTYSAAPSIFEVLA